MTRPECYVGPYRPVFQIKWKESTHTLPGKHPSINYLNHFPEFMNFADFFLYKNDIRHSAFDYSQRQIKFEYVRKNKLHKVIQHNFLKPIRLAKKTHV